MAALRRLRNNNWQEDVSLKEALNEFVRQGLRRNEILDYMARDFPDYAWSVRTLDRRLRYFEIYYTDIDVTVEQVEQVVREELEGPGKMLGYRAMQKKIRQVHDLRVPRDLVHAVMYDIDPEGLEERTPGLKKRKRAGHFTTRGPNWVHSLDGHDKLMGYQNNTFPIAFYGCIDTCSRKVLWVKVWTSNSNPKLIARFYLEHLYQTKTIASIIRVDKGTETVDMVTMHAYLRQHHQDMHPNETVIYGPSTANQIERWWREIHERLEKFYKVQLNWLKDEGHYDPNDEFHRNILAYLMVPTIQNEIDKFVDVVWNTHRIREQRNTLLPDGIPNHVYDFPEQYGLEDCGLQVTEQQLEEVAQFSDVFGTEELDDYLLPDFRAKCEELVPDPLALDANEYADVFCYLKDNIDISN